MSLIGLPYKCSSPAKKCGTFATISTCSIPEKLTVRPRGAEDDLTITTEAPRIIKIMVVVIICIKTSKLAAVLWPGAAGGEREGESSYPRRWRRSGWALGALSRQEQLMEPPRRSWLPGPFKLPGLPPYPPTHTHTHARQASSSLSLSLALSQPSLRPLSIQVLHPPPTNPSSPSLPRSVGRSGCGCR